METNTIIFLFTITHDIEEDMEIDKPCTNPTKTTLVVMECCLMKNQRHHQFQQFCLLSSVGVSGILDSYYQMVGNCISLANIPIGFETTSVSLKAKVKSYQKIQFFSSSSIIDCNNSKRRERYLELHPSSPLYHLLQ
jgi:hypothetical protein